MTLTRTESDDHPTIESPVVKRTDLDADFEEELDHLPDEDFDDDDDEQDDDLDDFDDDDEDENDELPSTVSEAQQIVATEDEATVERVAGRWKQYWEIARTPDLNPKAKLMAAARVSFAPEFRRNTGISLAVIAAIALLMLASAATPVESRNNDTATQPPVPTEVTPGTPNAEGGAPTQGVVVQTVENGVPTTIPATQEQQAGFTGQHIVQQGENLFRIAQRYNVDLDTLAAYNGITDPNRIYINQVINIPPVAGQPQSAVEAPVAQPVISSTGLERSTDVRELGQMVGVNRYCLNQGDTLSQVARMFNVSVEQLQAWNGIADPNRIMMGDIIWVGQPN